MIFNEQMQQAVTRPLFKINRLVVLLNSIFLVGLLHILVWQ